MGPPKTFKVTKMLYVKNLQVYQTVFQENRRKEGVIVRLRGAKSPSDTEQRDLVRPEQPKCSVLR